VLAPIQTLRYNEWKYFLIEDELTIPNLNVRGKKHKGSNEEKVGLVAEKLELIKDRVMKRVRGNDKNNRTVWNGCVSAMNKKLIQLRLKKFKTTINDYNSLQFQLT
jgi:hypothetical protein